MMGEAPSRRAFMVQNGPISVSQHAFLFSLPPVFVTDKNIATHEANPVPWAWYYPGSLHLSKVPNKDSWARQLEDVLAPFRPPGHLCSTGGTQVRQPFSEIHHPSA
jgi:hypothetical protein